MNRRNGYTYPFKAFYFKHERAIAVIVILAVVWFMS